MIDLRSDTVTQPSREMRSAMANAAVGDDVIGNDPTVLELQERVAEVLGKEAALFVPSGSMANQIALRVHCRPGDEFVCEADCHIYNYEQGGFAQLSGLTPQLLHGKHGVLEPKQLAGVVHPDDDHAVRTRLVTIENTHNRGGGTVQPLEFVNAIGGWAAEHNLLSHMDGARLFNAVVASGVPARDWAMQFDSVSVCFSKGLGAPIGSALAGTKEFVRAARRVRKLLGGGMRQAGIIAAGALFALENNVERLAEDHHNASRLAEAVNSIDGLSVDPKPETNIVLVQVSAELGSPKDFVQELASHGVLAFPFGARQIRLVTHMDVSTEQIDQASEALGKVADYLRQSDSTGTVSMLE